TPQQAIREYEQMQATGPLDDARRYGFALALVESSLPTRAVAPLEELLAAHPRDLWVSLARTTDLHPYCSLDASDLHLQHMSILSPTHSSHTLVLAHAN